MSQAPATVKHMFIGSLMLAASAERLVVRNPAAAGGPGSKGGAPRYENFGRLRRPSGYVGCRLQVPGHVH
eukprot:5739277-Pyramimonas_sp.AAC.1